MKNNFISVDGNFQEKADIEVECFSAIFDKESGRIIFFDGKTNCFYSLEPNTGELEVVAFVRNEYKWAHYGTGICTGEKEYWFPPCNSDDMIILRKDKSIEKIHIDYGKNNEWRFSSILCVNGYVCLIPEMCDGVVRIDKNNGDQAWIDDWITEYEKQTSKIVKGPRKSRYGSYLIEGSKVIVPLLWSRYLMVLDTDTWESSFIDTGIEDSRGYLAVYGCGRKKYLISKEKNMIVVLNENEDVTKYYIELRNDTFGRSVSFNNKLLIFGAHSYQVVVFDVESNSSKLFELDKNDKNEISYNLSFSYVVKVSEKELLAFDVNDHCVLRISSEDNWDSIEIRMVKLHYTKQSKELLIKNELNTSGIIKENREINLVDYLCYMGGDGEND